MNKYELGADESLEEWVIMRVDMETRNWSEMTWKILGIAQDLIDLKEIRGSASSPSSNQTETK